MDSVRKRIARAIKDRGLTYKDVSIELGRNHAYLQQFIERSIPAKLKESDRHKLSELLDIPEEELGAPAGRSTVSASRGDVENLTIISGAGGGGLLSVEYQENGSLIDPAMSDGFWSFPDSIKAGWRQMEKIKAMPVVGDSMEPTLGKGATVFVDTSHVYPSPEDIYVVDYGDGLVVKRLKLVPRSERILIISDNRERYGEPDDLHRSEVKVYGRVVAWFQWRG
jgi:hypothetical protein